MPLLLIVLLNILLHPINSYRYGIWSSYRNGRVIFLPRDKNQKLASSDCSVPFRGFEGHGGLFVEKFKDGMKFTWGDVEYAATDNGFSPIGTQYKSNDSKFLEASLQNVSQILFAFPCEIVPTMLYSRDSDSMKCSMRIAIKGSITSKEPISNNIGIEIIRKNSVLMIRPKRYFDFAKDICHILCKLGLPLSYKKMIADQEGIVRVLSQLPKPEDTLRLKSNNQGYCLTDRGFCPLRSSLQGKKTIQVFGSLDGINKLCLRFPYEIMYMVIKQSTVLDRSGQFKSCSDKVLCKMNIKLKDNSDPYIVNNVGIEILKNGSALTIQPKENFDFSNDLYDTRLVLMLPPKYVQSYANNTFAIEGGINSASIIY